MVLSYQESIDFIRNLPARLEAQRENVLFLPKKLALQGFDAAGKLKWWFRVPLLFPRMGAVETLENYATQLSEDLPTYLLLVLRANGNAAIGYFENGKILNHKVIRKYMVRQKQGKSQIKHLKTRGKSRAGSRVRLEQTIEFAEEINQKLIDWETEGAERILVSSSIDVWNLLFKVDVLPPFEKRDMRLRKVPYHIPTATFAELKKAARQITWGQYQEV